jgi:putative transposase
MEDGDRALTGELNYHLQRCGDSEDGDASIGEARQNSRNDHSKKTVHFSQGAMELAEEFEPILGPKHQRRLAGLNEKIISLCARGLGTREISAELEELCGVSISASLIREVTDEVLDEMKAWQSRVLE